MSYDPIRVCILLLQGYKNRYTYFFLFVYLIQKMSVCILRFILVSGLWASPKSICSLLSASEQILFCICPHHKGSDKYKKYLLFAPSHRAKYFLVERPQTLIQEFTPKYSRTFLYAVHLPEKIRATIYSTYICCSCGTVLTVPITT